MNQVLLWSDETKKKLTPSIDEETWRKRIDELKEFHGEK